MIKKRTALLISLACCLLAAGCSNPLSWFDTQPTAKKLSPVVFSATDASATSVAALNNFPSVPNGFSDINNFPVVPLNWTTDQDVKIPETLANEDVPVTQLAQSQSSSPGTAQLTRNTQYHPMIERVSDEVGIDADLLHAMIKVESNYKPQAVSHKGARGLLQVMPATGKRFGYTNLMDPEHNLRAGATYMKWLIGHFDNDLTLALAGYNAGEGAVKKYGRTVPPYKETRHYVKKVMEHYNHLQNSRPDEHEIQLSNVSPTTERVVGKKVEAVRSKKSAKKTDNGDVEITDKLLGLLLSQPKTTANKKHGSSVNEHAVL